MISIGLIALIAGMIAGFISLRSLGWMCVVGCLFFGSVAEGAYSWTVVENTGTGGTWYGTYSDGGTFWGSGNLSPASYSLSAGGSAGPFNQTFDATHPVTFYLHSGSSAGPVVDSALMSGGTMSVTLHTGGAGPPSYQLSPGCITNNGPGLVGFYLNYRYGDGSAAPPGQWYSGPLAPGQWACAPGVTNSSPFTVQASEVFYNSDLGTNQINEGVPNWAGTNTATSGASGGYTGGVIPGGNPGGGSGLGNNTNLTGGQFASGISNLINVQLAGNTVLGGQLYGLGQMIGSNTVAIQGQTNFDYRGYFQTMTNQGSGMLSSMSVTTNSLGQLITNTFLANIIGSNGGFYMSNLLVRATNDVVGGLPYGWNTNVGSTLSNYANGDGFSASNEFSMVANAPGNFPEGTNITAGGGPVSILDLPIRTNINGGGYWSLRFDQSSVWLYMAPWIRLLFSFIIFIFAVGYIHHRVSEEVIRLAYVPRIVWSTEALIGEIAKQGLRVVVSATILCSLPLLVGVGVGYVSAAWGGTPASPLSDTGIALTGPFANAVKLGFDLLASIFPFWFACTTMVYLFFFDIMVTGAVVWAQKLVRYMS